MDNTVRVENLAGLQRAFKRASDTEAKLLTARLKEAAEPVKTAGKGKAPTQIRNMTEPWSEMRVGMARGIVYMVPKQRGRKSKANPHIRRPNLKHLLLDRAMIPALEENASTVTNSVQHVLDTVGRQWERVP